MGLQNLKVLVYYAWPAACSIFPCSQRACIELERHCCENTRAQRMRRVKIIVNCSYISQYFWRSWVDFVLFSPALSCTEVLDCTDGVHGPRPTKLVDYFLL